MDNGCSDGDVCGVVDENVRDGKNVRGNGIVRGRDAINRVSTPRIKFIVKHDKNTKNKKII